MALEEILTLDDGTGTSTNLTFEKTEPGVFYLQNATLAEPGRLIIKHDSPARGGKKVDDFHQIKVSIIKLDSEDNTREGRISVAVHYPRAAVTQTDMDNIIGAAIAFLSDAARRNDFLNNAK